MKKKVILVISWLSVVIWMLIIFMFSSQNATTSVGESRKIIKDTLDTTIEASHNAGIIKDKPSEKEVAEMSETIDYPFRKMIHVSEYFILSLLVFNALFQSNVKSKKIIIIAIIICFLYACSDEIHQSFTERTAMFADVILDTLGSMLGILLISKFYKKKLDF